ncbi:hypothetical protein ABT150_53895 [Streptomyces mirabilis]|uniref:hypothetical protein n=1 Tax=Streptomyces mirabilis TaxID=68239 RepID=UPI0033209883
MTSSDSTGEGESNAKVKPFWRNGWNGQNAAATAIALTALTVSSISLWVAADKAQTENEAQSFVFARHVVMDGGDSSRVRREGYGEVLSIGNYNAAPVRVKVFGIADSGKRDTRGESIPDNVYLELKVSGCRVVRFSALRKVSFTALAPVIIDPVGDVWVKGEDGEDYIALFERIKSGNGKVSSHHFNPGRGPLYWHRLQGESAEVLNEEVPYLYPKKESTKTISEKVIDSGCAAPGV